MKSLIESLYPVLIGLLHIVFGCLIALALARTVVWLAIAIGLL